MSDPVHPAGARTFLAGDPDMYRRHVGRYGPQLARGLISAAGIRPGMTVVDVGCGPGALTAELVALLGRERVLAVEPSPSFAAACRADHGVDVREARAEALPFDDECADAVLSQLVVNFLEDAPLGLAEMRRVTRPGGMVGGLVWDYGDGMKLLRTFWDAAAESDPSGLAAKRDEGVTMPFCDPASLRGLWEAGNLTDADVRPVDVVGRWESFDEVWGAFEAGIGPSGAWVAGRDAEGRVALREAWHRRLGAPDGPFEVPARAWCVTGRKPA